MKWTENLLNHITKCIKSSVLNSHGAVLLEFAFSIPVLILLLMGLHDVFVISHMQDKSRLVAHEMASMLQNISQNREDKKITQDDIKRITCAAYLSIYPGTTMYSTTSGKRQHKYAHYPQPYIACVKSSSTNDVSTEGSKKVDSTQSSTKASTIWHIGASPDVNTADPTKCTMMTLNTDIGRLAVNFDTNVDPSAIYQGLKMKPNEVKILVDSNLFLEINNRVTQYSDGRKPTLKGSCGLRLLKPPHLQRGYCIHMFHSVAIFSPKKGLFDEQKPS